MLNVISRGFFPELNVTKKKDVSRRGSNIYFSHHSGDDLFIDVLTSYIKKHVPKQATEEQIIQIATQFLERYPASKETLFALPKKGARSPRYFRELIKRMNSCGGEAQRRELMDVLAITILPYVLNYLNSYIRQVVDNLLYIGPARARSERYYRYQELSVSEIDPDGKNFPMFLNSLGKSQVKQLSSWIEELFGYGLDVSPPEGEGGHISIKTSAALQSTL